MKKPKGDVEMYTNKMQNLSEKYVSKFSKAASELVMDEVTNTDDENKKTIIMFTAIDMARGALLKRNEHILTGIGIGIVGTTLALAIGIAIKRKAIKRYGVVLRHTDDENEGFMFVEALDEEQAKEKAEDLIKEWTTDGYIVIDAFEMK